MSEKIVTSVISALVGGIVGAVVVFSFAGKTSFDSLEVGKLTIKEEAKVLNEKGEEMIVMKEGSLLANTAIASNKFIGRQYQGHVFVANRLFTTPDDLNAVPMAQWRFFTEVGSSNERGGEVIVRSPNGATVVGQEAKQGFLMRTGFDEKDNPQLFAIANQNGFTAQVPFMVPNPRPAEGGPAPEGTAGTGAPAGPIGPEGTAVATDPSATPIN